jgi:transcriptional regulator with XRE-family HTH domain
MVAIFMMITKYSIAHCAILAIVMLCRFAKSLEKERGGMATTKSHREEFGARVRYFRELREWKIEDLALHVGKSASTISRIETGEQNVAVGDIKALAKALGVKAGVLLGDEHEASPQEPEHLAQAVKQRCVKKLHEVLHELEELSV